MRYLEKAQKKLYMLIFELLARRSGFVIANDL